MNRKMRNAIRVSGVTRVARKAFKRSRETLNEAIEALSDWEGHNGFRERKAIRKF